MELASQVSQAMQLAILETVHAVVLSGSVAIGIIGVVRILMSWLRAGRN
jgi:hypothetical protein